MFPDEPPTPISIPSLMQDNETMQVTFLSYEVKAKDTTESSDIAVILATSCEEILIDLVHEYL